ncbi:sensor histidine kinase [Labilibacter marinus]|uniref:sensor histidine kinase n=1 Tax=Labilibacter marinus TaxID=1477105 RepID=UPI00082DA174|nr:histidine kinase [Labilibacter marinus]
MDKLIAQNIKERSLIVISLLFSLFININVTIDSINTIMLHQSGTSLQELIFPWIFSIIMVFLLSWFVLSFNLRRKINILPKVYHNNPNTISIIGNILIAFIVFFSYIFGYYLFGLTETITEGLVKNVFGWSVVGSILIIISRTIKYQKQSELERIQKEKYKSEKLKSELKEIRDFLNPHFLFNSLNTLNALIRVDPIKASLFTSHLSRLYRYILQSKERDLVSIEEELFFIDNYTKLINIRFEDRFHVEINIPDKQKTALIPVLALQLLIENAVKHNEISKDNPLKVSIYIENELLVVTHPLQERRDVSTSTGNGISGLSKRCIILMKRDITIIKNKNFTVKVPIDLKL